MRISLHASIAVLAVCVPVLAFSAKPRPCVTADQAEQMLNKDVCVSAHVYEVVELPDGTRFLDVCSRKPPTTNAASPS